MMFTDDDADADVNVDADVDIDVEARAFWRSLMTLLALSSSSHLALVISASLSKGFLFLTHSFLLEAIFLRRSSGIPFTHTWHLNSEVACTLFARVLKVPRLTEYIIEGS